MKKLWICSAIALALGACKSNTWKQADKDAFVSTCTQQAQASGNMDASKAKNYCDCMLDKVQKKYPKAEDAGKMNMNEATEMAKDCLK